MNYFSDLFKKQGQSKPYITVGWKDSDKKILFRNKHIKSKPVSSFDKNFFNQHMLPNTAVHYRKDKSLNVLGSTLSFLAQTAVDEILAGEKNLTGFIFLKKSEFHKRAKTGTFVLKFKDFPFVLKLFIESPTGVAAPYRKGIIPLCIFLMNGASRHILGFTRIKNLEYINRKIQNNSYWKKIIDTPRKWFWSPKNTSWLKITTHNQPQSNRTITIPSIYGIIVDYIEINNTLSILNKKHRDTCLNLYNFLAGSIDPHIANFIVEKQSKKIIIIDTEHLPTIVGKSSSKKTTGYFSWYKRLFFEVLKNQLHQ